MDFMKNLYDTLTDVEGWKDTFREYTCPAVTGSILVPLLFVTPGGGFVAAYTTTTTTFGAVMGLLARYTNVEREILEGGGRIWVGQRVRPVPPLRLEHNNQGVNYPYRQP